MFLLFRVYGLQMTSHLLNKYVMLSYNLRDLHQGEQHSHRSGYIKCDTLCLLFYVSRLK